jgi:uncharacterized OsmC-like protein
VTTYITLKGVASYARGLAALPLPDPGWEEEEAMLLELRGKTDLQISGLEDPGMHLHGEAGGEGFGPLQMFAASLGLCVAAVLDAYAQGPLGMSTGNLRIGVRWSYGERPHRVDRFELDVVWPDLPDDRREVVERAIESCAIHRTLEHPPQIETRVHAEGAARSGEAHP